MHRVSAASAAPAVFGRSTTERSIKCQSTTNYTLATLGRSNVACYVSWAKVVTVVTGNGHYVERKTPSELSKAELMWRHKKRRAAKALRESRVNHPGLVRSLDTWLTEHPR